MYLNRLYIDIVPNSEDTYCIFLIWSLYCVKHLFSSEISVLWCHVYSSRDMCYIMQILINVIPLLHKCEHTTYHAFHLVYICLFIFIYLNTYSVGDSAYLKDYLIPLQKEVPHFFLIAI